MNPQATSFFDAIAGRYDRVYALPAEESRRRMQRIVRELPLAPAHILDLGVGTGRELSTLLDVGHRPTGMDASQAMLDRCARRSRPVPLVLGDFWAPLPFDTNAFDAAIALHGTLAHPPDAESIRRLARELGRVVRPGGVWIVEAPTPVWLDRLEALPSRGDGRIRRTGPRACVYEDLVVEASIEARVFDAEEWRGALGDSWTAEVEPLGEFEWFIVARRQPASFE